MKTTYKMTLFCIIALAQLAVCARMIFQQEKILDVGTAYKFKTRPIDPHDPFRGKYITLSYEINSISTNDSTWQRNEKAYVYLKDSLGYAAIDTVAKGPLNKKSDYIVAKVTSSYKSYDSEKYHISFELPFNRFYMEESKAQPAEDLLRWRFNDSIPKNIYSLVYIHKGEAVLDNVYVDEQPISEYVKEHR